MTDAPDHSARQQISDEDCSRSARSQAGSRPKPETHTNGRTQCNHSNVSRAQTALQFGVSAVVLRNHLAMAEVLSAFLVRVLEPLLVV